MEKELLIPSETIQARIKEIARQIASEYMGKEPVLLGILNGAVFFFSDLAMALGIPSQIDFIRAASYGSNTTSCGVIKFSKDVEIPIKGKHLLIIEDIVDTGLTINRIIKKLKKRDPESIRICALIDKLERREEEVTIDYCGFQVEEGFLVGYGLDHNEQYRCLPDIYTLK